MAAKHRVLLDAFADVRRTWDELVTLQPDVKARSGTLDEPNLVELQRRIDAHQMSVDALAEAVETEPSDAAGREVLRSGTHG